MITIFLLMIFTFFTPILAQATSQEIEFIQQFIKPGDLVFDVGANIGKKTDIYLACNARVICIEPQPDCCATLRKKFLNQPVTILQMGLADRSGTFILGICSEANTISTMSTEWQNSGRFFENGYRWDKQIEVEATTLDTLIAQFGLPQFCKIDVENFEYEVLQGLTKPIPYLSFEFAAETLHNTIKCIEYLSGLGYTNFNIGLGEKPQLQYTTWLNAHALQDELDKLNSEKFLIWGDIYAKF